MPGPSFVESTTFGACCRHRSVSGSQEATPFDPNLLAMSVGDPKIFIALVTWVGFAAWRRPSWALAGVLGVAYWLLLGSYNFIVLGCLAPAAMGALGAAARGGEWRRLGRWMG